MRYFFYNTIIVFFIRLIQNPGVSVRIALLHENLHHTHIKISNNHL